MYKQFFYLFLALVVVGCKSKEEKLADKKPNIVIFLADDQGWGDLSSSGNTNINTPNIDAIAENGISFDRFYVCPVCSPTRAELLTGRYHPRGGVYSTSAGGERLDLDETTLAEVFKSAGYKTGAFGKWHNGMQYPYHPNGRGFDEYYGFCSGHWGNYFSPMLEHNGQIVKGEGYIINDFTNKAIQFIENNREGSFLVYLPYNIPHAPMQVPDEWYDKYKDKTITQFATEADKEDIEFTRAALAMCENIDWNVGRVISKLKELNLEENTIVMYFTDNGPNSHRWNGEMKGRKGSTDEGGVRSPFYIQWPGIFKNGTEINEITGVIDLLPTLADLAGIDFHTNHPLDGVSLKPLLMDENPNWEERYIFNHWRNRTSVRGQKFKLDHQGNLYDMHEDPGQLSPVNVKFPEIAAKMMEAKKNWEDDVVAELPEEDMRTFPIGHPDYKYTQVPARDGIVSGNIKRSNRWPNCSFFTNWTSLDEKIVWPAEVLADGKFRVILYYTCPAEDVGSTFTLTHNESSVTGKITEAHDPPLKGMENDRLERPESYVKDFKPLDLGIMELKKGKGELVLQATEIPGNQVMDFRLLMFERVE